MRSIFEYFSLTAIALATGILAGRLFDVGFSRADILIYGLILATVSINALCLYLFRGVE